MILINTENMNKYKLLAEELNYLEIYGKVFKNKGGIEESEIVVMTSREFLHIAEKLNNASQLGFVNNHFTELNMLREEYRRVCIRVID